MYTENKGRRVGYLAVTIGVVVALIALWISNSTPVPASVAATPVSASSQAVDANPEQNRRSAAESASEDDPKSHDSFESEIGLVSRFVVVDATSGESLNGVEWRLETSGPPVGGVTESDGKISLRSGAIGGLLVLAREDFHRRWVRPAEQSTLPIGPQGQRIVTMDPKGCLVVRVLDELGLPIEGAYVDVLPFDGTATFPAGFQPEWPRFVRPGHNSYNMDVHEEPEASTNVDGEFRTSALPVGRMMLVRIGLAVIPQEKSVTIDPNDRTARLEFIAVRSSSITGRFVDGVGNPAGGVRFKLAPCPEGAGVRNSATHGRFRFRELLAGRYWLDYGGIRKELQIDEQGEDLDVGDLVVDVTARIEGRVVTAGNPDAASGQSGIVPVLVSLTDSNGTRSSRWVDGAGAFKATMAPGEFAFSATGFMGELLASGSARAPIDDLVIDLSRSLGAIEFQCDLPKGHPVFVQLGEPWVEGEICAPVGPRLECMSSNGRFYIGALPLGRRSVRIWTTELGGWWSPEIQINAGLSSDLGEIRAGYCALAGGVTAIGDAPAPSYQIQIKSHFDKGAAQCRDSVLGSFDVRGLTPGPMEILATGDEVFAVHRLALLAGEVRAGIELRGNPAGQIHGRVHCLGKPMPNVTVYVRDEGPLTSGRPRSVRCSSDGNFSFSSVRPGRVKIIIVPESDSGAAQRSTERLVSVESGDSEYVDVDLSCELELAVKGLGAMGAPPELTLFGPGASSGTFVGNATGSFMVPTSSGERAAIIRLATPAAEGDGRTGLSVLVVAIPSGVSGKQVIVARSGELVIPLAYDSPPSVRIKAVGEVEIADSSAGAAAFRAAASKSGQIALPVLPTGTIFDVTGIEVDEGRTTHTFVVQSNGELLQLSR